MYFNENNFYHGIMFHHFHDEKLHKRSQGSINKDDIYKIVKFIGRENILDSNVFYNRLKQNKLTNKNVCFTFDDCVKSQIDIALPVLEDLKIKSFFFIYSSLYEDNPDLLEVYRYFRLNCYNSVNDFYKSFFKKINSDLDKFFYKNKNLISLNKIKYPYYTLDDIRFRLVRDKFLKKEEYENIMEKLFKDKNFDPENFKHRLFLDRNDLIELNNLGHTIGLHSHNHPTMMENLSFKDQKFEYSKNIEVLSKIINKKKNEIKFMSHPCGSYNQNTLLVLNELGIDLGFKHAMSVDKDKGMKKINNSDLEIARNNHADIMMRL